MRRVHAAVHRDARDRARAAGPAGGRAARRCAWLPPPFRLGARRQASPRPTISGAGSVPERRPRSCPPPENSGASRTRGRRRTIQRADALRPVDLVAADRGEIDLPAGQVERDLSRRLREVGVEQRAGLLGDRGERRDVLHHADLVVHRHDADQQRRHRQRRRAAPPGSSSPSGRTGRNTGSKPSSVRSATNSRTHLCSVATVTMRRRSLPARSGEAGGALDGDVVALGRAGGEHHLLGVGADQRGDLAARGPRPRLPPRVPITCSTLCGLP